MVRRGAEVSAEQTEMVAAQSVRTLDEFLQLPEETPALEYHLGRITQKVSPQQQHGVLQLRFGAMLDQFVSARSLGAVTTELRSTYHGSSFVPDIAFCRESRLTRDERRWVMNTYEPPPDLAVEFLSPGQTRGEINAKCQWYVENGTQISLLLDPSREVADREAVGQEMVMLRGDDRIDLEAVLPGFEVTPSQIFALLAG